MDADVLKVDWDRGGASSISSIQVVVEAGIKLGASRFLHHLVGGGERQQVGTSTTYVALEHFILRTTELQQSLKAVGAQDKTFDISFESYDEAKELCGRLIRWRRR